MQYIKIAVEKVVSIHTTELARKGDILLFLPGKEEVEQACTLLQKAAPDLMTLPVYAALPFETQCQIFSLTPPGSRKVNRKNDKNRIGFTVCNKSLISNHLY